MKYTYIDAILSLRPGAKFHPFDITKAEKDENGFPVYPAQTSYDDILWVDDEQTQPTKQEVEAEIVRLNQQWEDNEYQRLRAPEYPSIGDQLDALYHAGVFPPEMASKIQAIKEKYPKPNQE